MRTIFVLLLCPVVLVAEPVLHHGLVRLGCLFSFVVVCCLKVLLLAIPVACGVLCLVLSSPVCCVLGWDVKRHPKTNGLVRNSGRDGCVCEASFRLPCAEVKLL